MLHKPSDIVISNNGWLIEFNLFDSTSELSIEELCDENEVDYNGETISLIMESMLVNHNFPFRHTLQFESDFECVFILGPASLDINDVLQQLEPILSSEDVWNKAVNDFCKKHN